MQACACSDSENCECPHYSDSDSDFYSESSIEETHLVPRKEKVLMAYIEEEEFKILSQIRAMEEGDMKEILIAAFMDQLRVSGSSKNTVKKPLFVDASFERNTKLFQKHQPHDKVRSLTLGEVSREIHHLKSEIYGLKSRIAGLEKGK